MNCFLVILEFIGGLILLFTLGWMVGHLFKLDKYVESDKNKENMKTKVLKSFMLLAVTPGAATSNSPLSYLIGGIIALLILGYLVYTLLRPEKF